jgi:hypothetical protein
VATQTRAHGRAGPSVARGPTREVSDVTRKRRRSIPAMVGQALDWSQRGDSRSVPDWVSPNLDIVASGESPDPHAMLLDDLTYFVTRHRRASRPLPSRSPSRPTVLGLPLEVPLNVAHAELV